MGNNISSTVGGGVNVSNIVERKGTLVQKKRRLLWPEKSALYI